MEDRPDDGRPAAVRTRAAGWSTSRSRRLRPARSWRRWDARAPSRGRSSTRSSSEPPGCAVRTPLSSTSSRTRRSGCLGSPAMSRWSSGATRRQHPMPAGRDSLLGRVAQDRTTQQIADVLADPGYGRHDLQHLAGYRALLSAPMLLNGDVIGILSVWRTEARPFDEGEVDLISTFAVPGGDRPAPGRARRGVGRPQPGARRQGHPARGAARDRRRGQLEPGPRGGPRRDRERRRTAHRRRRRLDHGVRPGRGQLPGAGHGRRHRGAHRSAA